MSTSVVVNLAVDIKGLAANMLLASRGWPPTVGNYGFTPGYSERPRTSCFWPRMRPFYYLCWFTGSLHISSKDAIHGTYTDEFVMAFVSSYAWPGDDDDGPIPLTHAQRLALEGAILSDRDSSFMDYSRYLLRTWHDLAKARHSASAADGTDDVNTSSTGRRVSLYTWVRRAHYLDDVWTSMSSAARELGLCVSPMVPHPPQFLLEGPSGHSVEVPTPVESSEACAGSVSKTTESPGGEEPVEPLLSSLQSNDQDVGLLPSAPETHEELPKDDDIDDWDYELDVTNIPILDPNGDPSMETDDPHFSVPFDDLMEMMRDPLPAVNEVVPQATTVAVESIPAHATPSLYVEATPNQGNPLSVSASIALNEGENELPTPSHPLLDSSMPHKEMGIPDKPSSQPFGPAMTGQGDPSPMPNLGVPNNDEEGSFAPLPPALDLPAATTEEEVPAKPSECFSNVENSGATSPLNASEPISLETFMISGDHRLDRSPQALEVLEARLAALRIEAVGTAGQNFMVRDQHTSLLSTQREKSARATLLRMLASCMDRSVAEEVQHSVALAARLLSLEVEQSRIHATIAALEAEVDLLRASDIGVWAYSRDVIHSY
ncbi:hypothetical protein Taro_013386 [Colocasia esculenta]|uniref:Aminotransferase-like plant mobile domain-containing protein n=1 Tax=Colocasia esculenta TaxID=4460 RepID=A0A843U6D9_COLES|nr:hypothetical protein [Colocasia esculenta]